MKTITLTSLLILFVNQFSFGQNDPHQANQFSLSYAVEEGTKTLRWTSNREVNSSHFIVEYSADGVNYEIIGSVDAGSSTYQETAYSFQDYNSNNSDGNYRVRLILMDGQAISEVLSIDNESQFASSSEK